MDGRSDGQELAGRYRLLRRLGAGAMGVVWHAVDVRLDREVAVKQLRPAVGLADAEVDAARQRVFREARIAARLRHPHVVTVYDVVDDGSGEPLLVMEYVPSRSLAVELAGGPLPPQRVAEIGAQVASGLAAAHAAGVVHRDVKPGNILLDADGAAKITDFGISRAVGDVTVTATNVLAGTPAYLAPEAARGEEPGPASDVFSLGATLYAAVQGTPPFGQLDNPIAQLHRVAAGHAPRLAGPLGDVLTHALSDDPRARPTMEALAGALAAVAAGSTPPPTRLDLHPVPAAPTVPAPASPSPRRTVYIVLAVLVAGLLVLLPLVLLNRSDSAPTGEAAPSTTTTAPQRTTTPRVDAAQLRQAVLDYYALLPDNPDQAWERLGPALRAQDRDRYDEFWKDVKDLRVEGAPQVNGETVTVRIAYTRESQGRVQETHRLGMLVADGAVLINSDQLVDTQVTSGDKKDEKEDKDKKGNKRDEDDDGN